MLTNESSSDLDSDTKPSTKKMFVSKDPKKMKVLQVYPKKDLNVLSKLSTQIVGTKRKSMNEEDEDEDLKKIQRQTRMERAAKKLKKFELELNDTMRKNSFSEDEAFLFKYAKVGENAEIFWKMQELRDIILWLIDDANLPFDDCKETNPNFDNLCKKTYSTLRCYFLLCGYNSVETAKEIMIPQIRSVSKIRKTQILGAIAKAKVRSKNPKSKKNRIDFQIVKVKRNSKLANIVNLVKEKQNKDDSV
jgi:hypothetical protein